MGNEQQSTTRTGTPSATPSTTPSRPPLAVRQPRRVEAEPVQSDDNVSRVETVLASLRPRV